MSDKPRSIAQIRREGYEALLERLGPADTIRFMQQYDPGHGDYTKERGAWLDNVTLDELMEGILKRRQARAGGANRAGETAIE